VIRGFGRAVTVDASGHGPSWRPYPVGMTFEARSRSRPVSGRSTEDVSDLDKRIIEHLQADGRRPYTQIAADLGVSEAAVRARTNRLIERGILQVVGVTDPLKLGFQQMAMIGIRCESDRLISVAEQVAEMPEVDYVVITAGTYDLLIETVCEDNDALLRFLTERLRSIDGVRETETFVYLRMVKQTYQWGTR
jgi:Lrp/AsnC family transcriptional regulator, regulator for asnA, asnC and gidA